MIRAIGSLFRSLVKGLLIAIAVLTAVVFFEEYDDACQHHHTMRMWPHATPCGVYGK